MSSQDVPPASRTRRSAITYYDRNGIVVTNRSVTSGPYRYELSQLRDLRRARGTIHPGVVIGLVTAVAEAVCVAPFVGLFHAPAAWLAVVVALSIPCFVCVFCAHRWPAQYELLADYRGRQVVLHVTRDEREFGQVARSVRRAREVA